MKILYVKNNSERAKRFQLKTIIYEKDNQKFVKKQALSPDAIPHLKRMKDTYRNLSNSIINPNLKLVKIIDESEDSLTFEFIEGAISFEEKFNKAKEKDQHELDEIIKEYKNFVRNSFKTTKFDSSAMVTDEFKNIFGDFDYSQFNEEPCFDGVSNIDLILSNILFKDDIIYLIDYEWVFDLNIPVSYCISRALFQKEIESESYDILSKKIEDFFINDYVITESGFYRYQKNFLKEKISLEEYLNILKEKIKSQEEHIKSQEEHIKNQQKYIEGLQKYIEEIEEVAQSLRIKNRLKKLFNIFYPLNKFNKTKEINKISDQPSKYNGKIIKSIHYKNQENSTICFFSHYDKDGFIEEYVFYYLEELKSSDIDIVFISTASNISDTDLNILSSYCIDIIIKENIGYDFGAWKTAFDYISNDTLENYDKLILCNDSVYAPLYDISEMIDTMQNERLDFWGITDSFEISYHLQSYFLFFNKNVFTSDVFKNFWANYLVYKDKRKIIKNYEIGLSSLLEKHNFTFNAYCSSKKLAKNKRTNITHFYWKELIIGYRCPIIKIELLRDNPMKIDIDDWEKILAEHSNYDIHLIKKHLSRVKSN